LNKKDSRLRKIIREGNMRRKREENNMRIWHDRLHSKIRKKKKNPKPKGLMMKHKPRG
jgi:hypothetical protein